MEEVGNYHLLLIDRNGREDNQLSGVTDTNKRAIIQKNDLYNIGDLILAKVVDAGQNTLFCNAVQQMNF